MTRTETSDRTARRNLRRSCNAAMGGLNAVKNNVADFASDAELEQLQQALELVRQIKERAS